MGEGGGGGGSSILYIYIAYYMQKKKGGGGRGVQIVFCKIAYVINGRPLYGSNTAVSIFNLPL